MSFENKLAVLQPFNHISQLLSTFRAHAKDAKHFQILTNGKICRCANRWKIVKQDSALHLNEISLSASSTCRAADTRACWYATCINKQQLPKCKPKHCLKGKHSTQLIKLTQHSPYCYRHTVGFKVGNGANYLPQCSLQKDQDWNQAINCAVITQVNTIATAIWSILPALVH